MSDLFVSQGILPMLLQNSEPFDSRDYIFELKLDGFRCIAYLCAEETVLKSRNNKDITALFPELKNMHKCVNKRCVLDGEIVCLKNGKPSFSAMQKRAQIKSISKIKAYSALSPVQFVAFDILLLNGKTLFTTPQIKRKQILQKSVTEGFNLSISRYLEEKGVAFFNAVKAQNLEGVVAKRKQGQYFAGKRTGEWLKIKAVLKQDFLVCGITLNQQNAPKSLVLASEENGALKLCGKVNLHGKSNFRVVQNYYKNNSISTPYFMQLKGVLWVKLGLVASVSYTEFTTGGNLRHPVLQSLKINL
ncbi:MAG: hypothetical protein E7370_06520 [Clostridiales bacterium]|nr:hypothetical protein [Clostridiales bacterium]